MHIITIQEAFEEVIKDIEEGKIVKEDIWVARRFSEDEEHQEFYQVTVSLSEEREVVYSGKAEGANDTKIRFEKTGKHCYQVVIEKNDDTCTYKLICPQEKSNLDHCKASISAADITPDGSKLIVGTSSGDLLLYDTISKNLIRTYTGAHFSTVSQIVAFPSSKVMLSVGQDLQTKLWEISESEIPCSRIFVEQQKAISSVALIGRGRNFVTSSLDGTVLLWECSTGQSVLNFTYKDSENDPATCVALRKNTSNNKEDLVRSDLLFDCENVEVFVGYKSGCVWRYNIMNNSKNSEISNRKSGICSLAIEDDYLISGYEDGMLQVRTLRNEQTAGGEEGRTQWTLQLNENHPIGHICASKIQDSELMIIVSNGPELLLQILFDGEKFSYSYMVGFSEMFVVTSAQIRTGSKLVTTTETVAHFS